MFPTGRTLTMVCGGVAALLLGAVACDDVLGTEAEAAPPQVFEVIQDTLSSMVVATGSVSFGEEASLTFGAEATVAEVAVTWGDEVKEGDVLARLETGELELNAAMAETSLLEAEEALRDLLEGPSAATIARAEASVTEVQASLAMAREDLAEMQDPVKAQERIDLARTAVDLARTAYDNAGRDLFLTRRSWETKLDELQTGHDDALEDYRNAFDGWLGITLAEDEIDQGPDSLLLKWGVDLDLLFDQEGRFRDINRFSEDHPAGGLPPDDPATPWDETVIYSWDNLFPGAIVATCEDDADALSNRTRCIKKEMDDAWDAFEDAKDELYLALTESATAIAQGESKSTAARDAVGAAEDALAALVDEDGSIALLQQQAKIESLEAALAQSQEDLAELTEPFLESRLKERQQQVRGTEAALAEAKSKLEQATMRAPFEGVVTQVNVETGQTVKPEAVAIAMVNPQSAEITAAVDEIDVGSVAVGQSATVTLDAIADAQLRAVVDAVSVVGRAQSGVVSYEVRLMIQRRGPGSRAAERGGTEDAGGRGEAAARPRAGRGAGAPGGRGLAPNVVLREGMSVTAEIETQRIENAVLVPIRAIQGRRGEQTVTVLEGEAQVSRPVRLGERNDQYVVVVEGLSAGETVVIPESSAASGGGRVRGGFGVGGLGGGRRR